MAQLSSLTFKVSYVPLQSTTSRTPVLYFLDAFVSPNLSKQKQGHETSKLFRLASNTEQFINMYTDWVIYETNTEVDRAAFKRSLTPFFEELLARPEDKAEEEEEEGGMLALGTCLKGVSTAMGRADKSLQGPTSSTSWPHLVRVAESAADASGTFLKRSAAQNGTTRAAVS